MLEAVMAMPLFELVKNQGQGKHEEQRHRAIRRHPAGEPEIGGERARERDYLGVVFGLPVKPARRPFPVTNEKFPLYPE